MNIIGKYNDYKMLHFIKNLVYGWDLPGSALESMVGGWWGPAHWPPPQWRWWADCGNPSPAPCLGRGHQSGTWREARPHLKHKVWCSKPKPLKYYVFRTSQSPAKYVKRKAIKHHVKYKNPTNNLFQRTVMGKHKYKHNYSNSLEGKLLQMWYIFPMRSMRPLLWVWSTDIQWGHYSFQ